MPIRDRQLPRHSDALSPEMSMIKRDRDENKFVQYGPPENSVFICHLIIQHFGGLIFDLAQGGLRAIAPS